MLAESIILDTSVMLSSTVAAASSSLQSNDGGTSSPLLGILLDLLSILPDLVHYGEIAPL